MEAPSEHTYKCPKCFGTGKIELVPTSRRPNPEPLRCSLCKGTGSVTVPAA